LRRRLRQLRERERLADEALDRVEIEVRRVERNFFFPLNTRIPIALDVASLKVSISPMRTETRNRCRS